MPRLFLMVTVLLVTGLHCIKKGNSTPDLLFETTPLAIDITGDVPKEVSGMADSERNPGYCWVHQDGGNPPELILLTHSGQVAKKIYLKDATNFDWEDMTLGTIPGYSGKMILIAETGNNALERSELLIYRFSEPALHTDTITTFQTIRFSYPDGPHDTEAILSDSTGDIYLITKRDVRSKVYRLTYPQSIMNVNMASFVTDLPYNGVVSADISPSGKELIIKTYTELKYYTRTSGQSLVASLSKVTASLAYQLEPLGEAVTFSSDGGGFFTLSEQVGQNPVRLYFYKRR